MNHGPLVFLAAFLGLSASWVGLVLKPQMQVGQLQQGKSVSDGAAYPLARPGLAREGLEVYRANGCAYCHSQQVGQSGTVCDVLLNQPGTNPVAILKALKDLNPGQSETQVRDLLGRLPASVLRGVTKPVADDAAKVLNATSAKAQVWIVPVGPDISRGWGNRRTVAQDYVFDCPVMLGSQRVGPDLANAGLRLPDSNWHLRHLFAPRLNVTNSTMPPYRFLFEARAVKQRRSPDALELPPEFAPPSGLEVVPRPEARALVAYLVSLRADAPLFEAPVSVASAAPATGSTNVPAGGVSSNNSPAK
jgi:cbb3-type cytochrome oxidase cytochrome c subunit